MKILVVCQNYYPEPFRVTDICEELVKQGNEVTVLTGLPNYPQGKVYDGYKDKNKRRETINGVDIHRCFEIARRKGIFFRFLNYYSFASSSKKYIRKFKDEFDVVLVNQLSPIMMAEAGVKFKKKFDKKLVLYCLDLWPESLTVGGIKRGSIIYKHYHKLSKKIYTSADILLCSSKSFSDYFEKEFGISNSEYLPQYAESLFDVESCRKKKDNYIDLMFAGNIGAAQSVKTIINTADKLQSIENLRWHIVGDGSELENCKELANSLNLKSVIFHGRKSLDEMPKYYSMADAMIVSMCKNPTISLTLPGKVQTYLAAGKPIIGSIDGEGANIINEAKCGYVSEAEDVDKLVDIVVKFIDDVKADNHLIYSKNAVDYYNENFSKKVFMQRLISVLQEETIT